MTLRERIMQRMRDECDHAHNLALEDTEDQHFKRTSRGPAVRLDDIERILAEELPAADADREGLAAWLDGVAKAYATTDADMPQPPPNVITYSDSVNAAKAARLLREPAGINARDIYGAMEAERSEVVKNIREDINAVLDNAERTNAPIAPESAPREPQDAELARFTAIGPLVPSLKCQWRPKDVEGLLRFTERLTARVAELEASIARHFIEEHLAGDGPEIDRWKAKCRKAEAELASWRRVAERLEAEKATCKQSNADLRKNLVEMEAELARLRSQPRADVERILHSLRNVSAFGHTDDMPDSEITGVVKFRDMERILRECWPAKGETDDPK